MSEQETTREFPDEQAALDYIGEKCEDECIDNYRFAYLDDSSGLAEYAKAEANGCCGFVNHRQLKPTASWATAP